MNISVIINTNNEERNIEDCILSAKKLTDNIHVFDMHSNDKTETLSKKNGAIVHQIKNESYVEPARETSIKENASDWVFILDADERMTDDLATEIKNKIKNPSNSFCYYRVPRKNIFGKIKWLKHGGWWPDYQIRLIKKDTLVSWPKKIHSTPIINGSDSILENPLEHYFHSNLKDMVEKTLIFENIEATLLFKADKKTGVNTFFRKFFGELNRRLILKLGFLDGDYGLIESLYQSFSKAITYLFLYEKKLKNRSL